jgi:hypothetical protein
LAITDEVLHDPLRLRIVRLTKVGPKPVVGREPDIGQGGDHDVARGIALAFGVHLRSATGLSEATPPSGRISRIAVRRGTAPQRCASGAVRIFGTVSTLLPS